MADYAKEYTDRAGNPQRYLEKDNLIQDLNKLDVVGNGLGLPHLGDARNYADGRPGIVQGPADDAAIARARRNPDGSITDPATGQTYTQDASGAFQPVANPNVAQQVGANLTRASGFYDQVPGYDAREAASFQRQASLVDHLSNLASGAGPTVAGTQLAIGQQAAAQQQLAQAAGAGGNNAALARMTAANNVAAMQTATNQAQALARAQEAAAATAQLGAVTGNMTNQSRAMADQKIGAGQALTGMSLDAQNSQEADNAKYEAENSKADQARKDKWTDMGVGTLGKLVSF